MLPEDTVDPAGQRRITGRGVQAHFIDRTTRVPPLLAVAYATIRSRITCMVGSLLAKLVMACSTCALVVGEASVAAVAAGASSCMLIPVASPSISPSLTLVARSRSEPLHD